MTVITADQAQLDAERAGLSARLNALARLVQIGSARRGADGFSDDLIAEASALLTRAGERLMLSAEHTVVALAGGTGSGKSSLFNRLAGAEFSAVGVTRPVTSDVHACVWGVAGSGPLLEWVGVPRRYRYARSSALDSGEQSMNGLVLLDMPDHDSVMGHATDQVDRLVGLSDLMIWVLDPQKYADRAVHRRFLVPLAGHSEVVAVVLNQSDLLAPVQVEECVGDLRRLLDSENLHDVQVLVTSAATGAGVEELRKLLIDTVSARRASAARIAADVDKVVAGFRPYGELSDDGPDAAVPTIPAGAAARLASDFAAAAGVAAIGDSVRSARELRAMDYIGWPVSWMAERVTTRDPVRKIRLGKIWEELRGVTTGPAGAQRAEIDNSLTELADQVTPPLPPPWSRTVRAAVRSRTDEIPPVLGGEIGAALPAEASGERWWRVAGIAQGLLLGLSLVGLAWFGALLAIGVFGAASGVPMVFTDRWLLPVAVLLVVVALLAGYLIAGLCERAVEDAADRERDELVEDIRQRMEGTARHLVIAPAEHELAELERFRTGLEVAAGRGRVS
ncbi:MAG TPA: GTPase [Streptosporangiaceae bacterium]|nr:GTPase [Streptosporangiaceae bacterium]